MSTTPSPAATRALTSGYDRVADPRGQRIGGEHEQDPDPDGSREREDPEEIGPPDKASGGAGAAGPAGGTAVLATVVPALSPRGRGGGPGRCPLLYSGRPRPQRTPPSATRRSTIAREGRIGRPVRRPGDQPPAIRRDDGGATREKSISVPGHPGPTGPFRFVRGRSDAGHGDRRTAVGRRGQGQDDRLPRRADRHGRALPGWRQRRPHRRPRRRGLQAAAHAVGRAVPAHHVGHRQRGGGQPADAHRRARRADRARHRRRTRPGEPQRARDHALQRRPRPGERIAAGGCGRRDDRAGHRPDVRRPRMAARAAHGGPAGSRGPARAARARAPRQEPPPRRRWVARRSRSTRSSTQAAGWGDRLRDHFDDTTWLVQAPSRAASTCCSRARRARSSISTTGSTRSSPRRTRWPAARAPAAASGRSRSTRSSAS